MPKQAMLQQITLGRLEMAIDDLLAKRVPALKSFPYGAFVVPDLTDLQSKIGALPAATKSKPFSEELAMLDRLHDGHGSACWFLVEAHLRSPDTTPEMRATLESIRAVLGSLDETTATYDAEAKAAQDRQAHLANIAGALQSIPVAGGKTLYDWAKGYVDAGIEIGGKLSARADTRDRESANLLRSEAVGTLNETRRQLRRALKKDTSLPPDLEAQVFAWLDELEKTSAAEAAEAKKTAGAKKAGDPAPPQAPPTDS